MTSSPPPPTKPRLNPKTRRLIRKRKEWRTRALEAALQLTTWPPGKPGREAVETETIRSLNKVHAWFRAPRARLVVSVIQRRAVAAFRAQ